MLDRLRRFITGLNTQASTDIDPKLATAVLLLEAAHGDGDFAPAERAAIKTLLTNAFSLSADELTALLATAEARSADLVQLHPYTTAIADKMTPEQRLTCMEMLWEVVYADGVLDPEEDALIRKLATLIYVDDRDRVLARQRVQARLQKSGD
jgi:uncharacterized tellurite resistance protein B-like protein